MTSPTSKKKSTTRKKAESAPDWRYEETVEKIEIIIDQIEAGSLDLEDVFDQFSVAMNYLQECDTFLTERQEKMELLIETLGDGSSQ